MMDADFWHERWEKREIAFHEPKPNHYLRSHFASLSLPAGARVLVPLCGKSTDLGWLAGEGYQVLGVELNRGAVEEFFSEAGITPEISQKGQFICFRSEPIEILVGDFFALDQPLAARVDAVYDRAALIALPQQMRVDYAQHLMQLSVGAPQLLITIDYSPGQTEGPPFSVPAGEVKRHYSDKYEIKALASATISGPLAKRCSGTENAWQLNPLDK